MCLGEGATTHFDEFQKRNVLQIFCKMFAKRVAWPMNVYRGGNNSDHFNSTHQYFGPILRPEFWVQNHSPSAYIMGAKNKVDVKISAEIDVV